MDREALQALLHGVTRVGHGLVTKPPLGDLQSLMLSMFIINLLIIPAY